MGRTTNCIQIKNNNIYDKVVPPNISPKSPPFLELSSHSILLHKLKMFVRLYSRHDVQKNCNTCNTNLSVTHANINNSK